MIDYPISNTPNFVDAERGKALLNKWSKMLNYTDTPSVSGQYKKLSTAIVLESQEAWLSYTVHDTTTYYDGGTILLNMNIGKYSIDHRIGSTTDGRVYNGYPKDDNSNILPENWMQAKRILEAYETYMESKRVSLK